jgi:hypothetical protein
MPRHCLCVVAGRHCDHTAFAFRITQQRQAIGGTALFEGTHDLQVVQLQHHLGASGTRNCVAWQSGRTQNAAGDPFGRRRHISE